MTTAEPVGNQIVILEPNGRLTAETVDEFTQTVSRWLGHGRRDVILDLRYVTYLDSAGIGALAQAYKCSQRSRRTAGLRARGWQESGAVADHEAADHLRGLPLDDRRPVQPHRPARSRSRVGPRPASVKACTTSPVVRTFRVPPVAQPDSACYSPRICRFSHIFAVAQSRLTVAGAMSRTSAISSTVKPAKKRISTISD